jgi:DNA-binding transcriptional LysR family regulator
MRPLDWSPVPSVTTVMAYRKHNTLPTLRAFREIVRECFPPPE